MASLHPFQSLPGGTQCARLLWLFVAALLFGAVAPIGPPGTVVHEAAFNPATTSVAIAAKRGDTHLVATLQRVGGGSRIDGTPGASAVLPLAAGLTLFLIATAGAFAAPSPVSSPAVRCGVRGPRAPPRRA